MNYSKELLNLMPGGVGIYYLYNDNIIEQIYVNNTFDTMMGKAQDKREDFNGKNFINLVFDLDRESLIDSLVSISDSEKSAEVNIRMEVSDCEYKWFNIKTTIVSHCEEYTELIILFTDINELKTSQLKAEELAKAMSARIRLEDERIKTGDNKLSAYIVCNLTDGYIIDHSEYAPNAPEAANNQKYTDNILAALESVVYEDDKKEFLRIHNRDFLLSEFRNGRTAFKIEFRRKQNDGMISWVRNVLHLVENPDTTKIMLYEYCYDINATKSVEVVNTAAIISTFDCLASIDLIHDQTTYLSQDNIRLGKNVVMGIYHTVAAGYINRFVVSEDVELCNKTFAIDYIRQKLKEKAVFEFTYKIKSHDEKIHIMRNKYVYYDAAKCRCLMMRTDVTDVVKKEEERKHKIQIAEVVESIPGGILILDTKKNRHNTYAIKFCSQGVARLAGYNVDEFSRVYEEDIQRLIFKSDLEAVNKQMEDLANGGKTMDITYRGIHKDGSIFWIRECANIITETDGSDIIVALFQNVSEDTKLYQNIIDSSANVIQVIDRETREIYYANKAATDLAGTDQYAGMHCYEFFGHTDKPCEFCNFVDGKLTTKEMEITQHNKIYMASGNLSDWHGRNVFAEVLTDITNHKRLQKHYESYLASVTQTVTDATIAGRVNVSKNICYSIKSELPTFNLESRVLEIKDLIDYVLGFLQDESEREEYVLSFSRENLINEYSRGNNSVSCQQHCELSDGTLTILQSTVQMTVNPETGDIEGVLFARDVTQDKVNEQIFTKLLPDKYEGIELIDVKNGLCSVRRINYTDNFTESVINENYYLSCHNAVAAYIHPDDRDMFLEKASIENLVNKLSTKELYSFTVRNLVDGRTTVKTCTYCYIGRGTSTVMGTIEDVTEVVADSEKQKEELQNALELANESTKAKSDFLARMSHDLRTPINTIVGLQALALDDIGNADSVRSNLIKMHDATDFMLSLINDLLDMSEIESGKIKFNKSPYQYRDFMKSMETMFRPQCEKRGIKITFPSPKSNPMINVDKLKLNRIIFNVLSNAVKYTPTGGSIDYYVNNFKKDDKKIYCDFVIEDTGIGMSKEFQDRMFEAFAQENKEVTSDLQGSGVGLSITKQLVEQMGGTISIDSEKDKGTKVTISMSFELIEENVVDVTVSQTNKDDETKKTILHGKRVLLAEDHVLNARIAKKILEKEKMVVTLAQNGQAAVDLFNQSEENFYQVVLMDIRMPIMNGLDATRQIRSLLRKDAKTVPIIAMSANAYEDDIKKSLESGMNAHMAKPVEPQNLYNMLESIFKQNESYND